MQIQQAQVEFTTTHQQQISRSTRESLTLFRISGEENAAVTTISEGSTVSLSSRALRLARQVTPPAKIAPATTPASVSGPPLDDGDQTQQLDSRLLLIKQVVEHLSGRPIEFIGSVDKQTQSAPETAPATEAPSPSPNSKGSIIGMRYQRVERYEESEQRSFSALASVTTADGRTINLNLQLTMSRQFITENGITIDAGARLTDPLVVNLAQAPTRLADETVSFDLNADGRAESFHFVDGNSALLALDRNGDGVINNGSELFGALSGNGFSDLAAYDDDGNGFIDAGDSVFADLKLWIREAGEDRLIAVADQGIGAFYLGYADGDFSLKDDSNRLQGMIRSTGVYLNEDGSAGTLQQIDLVT